MNSNLQFSRAFFSTYLNVALFVQFQISSVTKNKSNGLLSVNFDVNGDKRESINDVDKVLLAIGRSPSTESLNLPAVVSIIDMCRLVLLFFYKHHFPQYLHQKFICFSVFSL